MRETGLRVAVIIATSNRPELLSTRALRSVAGQTRRPDQVVVVDDSAREIRPRNRALVETALPGLQVDYLDNARTKGASGSWNTALDLLLRDAEAPESLFIAILDDDDAWAPAYLAECAALADSQALDMVAADLRRIEDFSGTPLSTRAPAILSADDFLTGNPGIQGSNLFVRLSVLLAAGGFDEALQSSTDRDLCIRLADLGSVRYARLPLALVDHFADAGRDRLSARGSPAKLSGLTAFWNKYVGRMTAGQRRAFSDRAQSLFGWSPQPVPAASKRAVIVGLVVRAGQHSALRRIVEVLRDCDDAGVVGLDIVLLAHGTIGDPALGASARSIRDLGAGCFCFESADFPAIQASEMLRICSARVADARVGAEVWLANCRLNGRGHATDQMTDILHWLGATRLDAEWRPPAGAMNARQLEALDERVWRERVATARHRIARQFAVLDLRLLGCGSEAVVFTDERTVYKCIDYWKTRMVPAQVNFLRSQVGRWVDMPGLCAIRELVADGPWVLLTYDYESSVPYTGGHEADLVALMASCARMGVVCNNVHPKNLILTRAGVKLIDYGSDVRPWCPLGFEQMARRAFLASRHASHPDLASLMRRSLTDDQLPELAGYARFRASLGTPYDGAARPPGDDPFALYVGVISGDARMLQPLLVGLASLKACPSIKRLHAVVLDNGCVEVELSAAIDAARRAGVDVALISAARQRLDAERGAFGAPFRERPAGQVGIAQARTMLQRYLGALLGADSEAFGWLLDDDMRVDDRALEYLPWLPAFRAQGVDVLLGHYEGSSPNPPLNGLRVQLVDLLHNLMWLQRLPQDSVLPDRGAENAALRARYPDYYYDLSRKHTAHLEMPHWLEPAMMGETVEHAHRRLLAGAMGLLSGDPLTRSIVAKVPKDPLEMARDSVNRGGCTFILNPIALTHTPNIIPRIGGREARRSDMVWAIVNRYCRGLTIKAVGFPIQHLGRVTRTPSLNMEKVHGEIIGSSLYAGLTGFLRDQPGHALDFSAAEIAQVCHLVQGAMRVRLAKLEQSFHRISGLGASIRRASAPGQLVDLLAYLDRWFTPENFELICQGVRALTAPDVARFLTSLRGTADEFAAGVVNTDFIQRQWSSIANTEPDRGLR